MIENAPGGKDPGYWGHGVIGKERFDREEALLEAGANIFGPGVTGKTVTESAPVPEPQTVPSLSVRELREAIMENPALVDAFLPAELQRVGGPRLGALRAFWDAEDARSGGPRQEVLEQIMDFLPSDTVDTAEDAEPAPAGAEG